eukprot:9475057-Pyramimonas_sp.AAC.1
MRTEKRRRRTRRRRRGEKEIHKGLAREQGTRRQSGARGSKGSHATRDGGRETDTEVSEKEGATNIGMEKDNGNDWGAFRRGAKRRDASDE